MGTSVPLNHAQRSEVGHCPSVKVFESIYKLEWMSEPWNDVERARDWLLEVEDNSQLDIVHLRWGKAKNLPAPAEAAPGISWPVYVAGDTADQDGRSKELNQAYAGATRRNSAGQLKSREIACAS